MGSDATGLQFLDRGRRGDVCFDIMGMWVCGYVGVSRGWGGEGRGGEGKIWGWKCKGVGISDAILDSVKSLQQRWE